jgi:hypothetical protein
VRNYLIFYRPTDQGIEVVRVLHGARDLPPLFEYHWRTFILWSADRRPKNCLLRKNEPFDVLAVSMDMVPRGTTNPKNIMKTVALLCLSFLVTRGAVAASGEQFRTEINPALQYYQAFLAAPDLEQADRDFLLDWRGQKLPEKAGELVSKYDGQFSLVRRAAHATVPCDWGIDWSTGPATLLPHLARSKAIVQTSRFRAMWDLQQGRQADACDDLLAAFVLGRNVSCDGTLVSVLVQIANEAIVCSTVAENFGKFSPEALQQLVEGFDTAPGRRTVAASITSEKSFFHDWAVRKIQELQQQNPGNDDRVMEGVHQFLHLGDPRDDATNLWAHLTQAAGGTSEGVLKLFGDRERVYQKLSVLLGLPYAEYETQAKAFSSEFQDSSNPLVSVSVPSLLRARARELRILATLDMVRAAVEYKLHGDLGFQKVTDPCGNGPFAFRRFVFEGVDRGFELKSAYDLAGDPGVLIFVEKQGPPFRISGPQAGKALSNEFGEDAFRRRYGLGPPK